MKNTQEIGSLLLRLVLGFTFFMHGLDKFQGGVENVAAGFPAMGLPSFLAYIVATIELVGGIALILGFGTRIFAGLMACIMLGAILFVKLDSGFVGGFEFDVALLIIAIQLVLNGSSLLALDSKLPQIKSFSTQTIPDDTSKGIN
ncbi:DoxX family protein [Peribacillus asahii]|uniref:DoxX family protein n=1 Tax=Peribacillus asahii TaxID=228899 RepID=UPI00207A93DD|nr:DoxX family protein [Peribacillus asahii]USK72470.1 DoxX family protein [Peribacillus asahii]